MTMRLLQELSLIPSDFFPGDLLPPLSADDMGDGICRAAQCIHLVFSLWLRHDSKR
jgi:hypothetical protein